MVRDAAAVFAEPAGQLGLGEAELAHEGAVRLAAVEWG